jgi:hypothetical protein
MSSDSDEIPIDINIVEKGTIKATLVRHLSPFSVEAIAGKMPLTIRGRFNFMGAKTHWMLSGIGISVGADSKATHTVEKGDIVYCPRDDSIYIFIEDDKLDTKINKIGRILDLNELELFKDIQNGTSTELKK